LINTFLLNYIDRNIYILVYHLPLKVITKLTALEGHLRDTDISFFLLHRWLGWPEKPDELSEKLFQSELADNINQKMFIPSLFFFFGWNIFFSMNVHGK